MWQGGSVPPGWVTPPCPRPGSPGSAGLPEQGHQVVQSHRSGSGAICPPGHEHRGCWMRQQVPAARAIPRCRWQLVGGTGLCPDGPRFWGTARRDQDWSHPSHISGGGREHFLLLYSPYHTPVICHPWQYHRWQCHPIPTQAGSHPRLPRTCTACHLPSAALPRSSPVCSVPLPPPLCVFCFTAASHLSLIPKLSDKSLFSASCASLPDILYAPFFHPTARSYFLTSLPRCPDAFFFFLISFFLTIAQFPFYQWCQLGFICLVPSSATARFSSIPPLLPSRHSFSIGAANSPSFLSLKKCSWGGNSKKKVKIITNRSSVAANLFHRLSFSLNQDWMQNMWQLCEVTVMHPFLHRLKFIL